MGILNVENLSHSFGEKDLYNGVSFELNKNEHMGIVGQNGAGKSTLLNILLGKITPSGGRVVWQRNVEIGHIDQYAELDGGLTIEAYLHTAFERLYRAELRLQELYMNMGEDVTEKQLRQAERLQQELDEGDFYSLDSTVMRVATGLGLDAIGMDRKLETLSGGQRTKTILAKLLLAKPDALLLDEPTNFLDVEHIRWLTEYLSTFEGSFMIISHDFEFLEGVTNCICDIEFQAVRKYHGKYSDFLRQKAHLRADYIRRYNAQRKETEKLEEYIAKNKARASTAALARSRQKALDRMEKLPPPQSVGNPNIAFKQAPLMMKNALELRDLVVGYDYPLLPRLNLAVDGGQKVVITGFNGIGKSTLLKTIVGVIPALGGAFEVAPSVRIGYFEQDMHWEDGGRTPLQLMDDWFPGLNSKQLRRELARCGLSAAHATRGISSLSGGEQNKVKLCRVTMSACNFLVLDEPTNHLDAQTKESLGKALAEFSGSVILVCHEPAFYKDWADRVIDIEKYLK